MRTAKHLAWGKAAPIRRQIGRELGQEATVQAMKEGAWLMGYGS